MPEFIKEDNKTLKMKRLLFRSWHRGTREIDLLLGKFADEHVPTMTEEELDMYDKMLANNDPDIYNWVTGQEAVPELENSIVVQKLLSFYNSKN